MNSISLTAKRASLKLKTEVKQILGLYLFIFSRIFLGLDGVVVVVVGGAVDAETDGFRYPAGVALAVNVDGFHPEDVLAVEAQALDDERRRVVRVRHHRPVRRFRRSVDDVRKLFIVVLDGGAK